MRYMMLLKMDPASVPEGEPSEKLMADMGSLIDEMTKAGVLLDTGGLHPVEEATVVRLSGGRQTVLDGPFTEAKEVVGGYCVLQAKSHDEAVEWASRFLAVHGDRWEMRLEIRQIDGPQ